jgi:hypothetical protein
VLIETFVEKPRFSGTCYKAATTHAHALPLKSVWVFPLAKRFRQILTG